MRRLRSASLMVLVAACERDPSTAFPSELPLAFQVSNNLVAPITVSIDGASYVELRGGASGAVIVPASAQWLTWTSAKPMDAAGTPIPDDIGEIKVPIRAIDRVLEVSNVIQDQTYITARILNLTTAAVSIGVSDGSTLSCAAALPASSASVTAFTQIGYYRLLPSTTLRAYRDPARCTGPYVSWPAAELKSFAEKSGLLILSLETAP